MSRTETYKRVDTTYRYFWTLCLALLVAGAFGGGGSRYGFANLIVQLTAIFALSFHRRAFVDFWASAPIHLRALVALSALLPALFLIPLPPQFWTVFPGRELVVQSFELAGGLGWAPASVDPGRTLLALTALITPLAILVMAWNTPRKQLVTLGWIVVILGLANLTIGTVQVLSNGEAGLLYPENPMPGVLFGTFANRNSAGLFLVGCLAFAALLPAPKNVREFAIPARMLICAMLALAILLTRSRTALVLAGLPLGVFAIQTLSQLFAHRHSAVDTIGKRKWPVVAVMALTLSTIAAVIIAAPGRVNDVVDRFQNDRIDARTYIWEDAAYSADRYWPIGSGLGTFDEVFQIDESLENVTLRRAGRAHNDYLEIAIEAGLSGLLLVGAWLVLLAWLSWKARSSDDRWIAWSGAVFLLAIALQSITDYPLRNHTILAVAAFALIVLVRFGAARKVVKP
ncbi:MAG: O-antigen ligase family protein [Pseudomonadota bacterium]